VLVRRQLTKGARRILACVGHFSCRFAELVLVTGPIYVPMFRLKLILIVIQ
jgi:hypothetical protein